MIWWQWALAAYALVTTAILYMAQPQTWREFAACVGWPFWFLIVLIEVTEEARRNLRR